MTAKTPKAVVQLALAVATEKTDAAPESIVEHEQIRLKSQSEAIAKARSISALRSMWETLLSGRSPEEFERRGYGLAIRRRARAVLLKEQHKAGNGAAGVTADAVLERLIREGELPPRPGQVIAPPAPPTADNVTPISKAKRSRKKAANG